MDYAGAGYHPLYPCGARGVPTTLGVPAMAPGCGLCGAGDPCGVLCRMRAEFVDWIGHLGLFRHPVQSAGANMLAVFVGVVGIVLFIHSGL